MPRSALSLLPLGQVMLAGALIAGLGACGQGVLPGRVAADGTTAAPSGVSAQGLFENYEYRNVISNPGRAGAEAYLGEVRPAGVTQNAVINVVRTLSSSRTVSTGFSIGVDGALEFETQNGGVSLSDVAGDVKGKTQNGGVNVSLSGSSWRGGGLDVDHPEIRRAVGLGAEALVPVEQRMLRFPIAA